MKQIKNLSTRLLLIASLMLTHSPAGAVETFEQAGPISKIGYAGFTVDQQQYRIAPGAKLKSFDASRRRLSDFEKGDVIIFKGKIVNDVYFVDMIVYYAPIPS